MVLRMRLFVTLIIGCVLANAPAFGQDKPTTPDPAKIAACTKNLQAIHRAVSAYRLDHGGDYPAWLSVLYPKYVANMAVFHCPNDATPGTIGSPFRPADPKAAISYDYALNLKPGDGQQPILGKTLAPGWTWRNIAAL